MEVNYSALVEGRFYKNGEMVFNPLFTTTWAIFLYRLSRLLYLDGEKQTADAVYYLNKIMHSVEWFYEVDLPVHFIAEHPLGCVLGKAKYGDYLSVYQGVTVGGNRKNEKLYYPMLGNYILLYANATVLGDTQIGSNVIVSANTYIINTEIPDDCIVFGQSPNLIIKKKSKGEMREMMAHTWK